MLPRARSLVRSMASSARRTFLGVDSSTQGCKATLIDDKLNVVATHAVNYQKEFGAAYGLENGVVTGAGSVVRQPTMMVRARGAAAGHATRGTTSPPATPRLALAAAGALSPSSPFTSRPALALSLPLSAVL